MAQLKLSKVVVDPILIKQCFNHVLSTEYEEVMGLLFGEFIVSEKNKTIAYIYSFKSLVRMDRQKDRVEVSPEQLVQATEYAEELKGIFNRPGIQIIGWLHSHPHITVFPSKVDLRTQSSYQQLHRNFFGLIISCFSRVDGTSADNSSSSNVGNLNIIAFQAVSDDSNNLNERYIKLKFDNTFNQESNLLVELHENSALSHSLLVKQLSYQHAVELLKVLYNEERENFNVYYDADQSNQSVQNLHVASVYQQALSMLLSFMVLPLQLEVESRLKAAETLNAQLKQSLLHLQT